MLRWITQKLYEQSCPSVRITSFTLIFAYSFVGLALIVSLGLNDWEKEETIRVKLLELLSPILEWPTLLATKGWGKGSRVAPRIRSGQSPR